MILLIDGKRVSVFQTKSRRSHPYWQGSYYDKGKRLSYYFGKTDPRTLYPEVPPIKHAITQYIRYHGQVMYLNTVWMKCGVKGCHCQRSREERHGPYWKGTYSDPETGKPIQMWFGRELPTGEGIELDPKL